MRLILIATVMLLAFPLVAADRPKKGDDAPDFKVGGRVINPPEFGTDLDSCKGKVIILVEWNRRDNSKNWLPKLEPLWKKYGGSSLMIYAIHRLKDTEWRVREHLTSKKITFPVCMGYFYDEKNDFGKYAAGSGKFSCCVIGLDQKIAYWNTTGSPDVVAEKLLKKIEYAGLQKQAYSTNAKPAAAAFGKGKYGRALNEAKKIMDGEFDEQEKEDAEYVSDAAQALADVRQSRIDEAKADGRLDILKINYQLLRTEFASHEIGDKAKEALKLLKKDKDLRRERDAFEDLDKLKKRNQSKEPTTQANGLRAFAKVKKGTKAAEVAKKLASQIESWHDDM
ncbi:MAG: hypothetical protein L3J82_04075 [Planctomycetes bacterium]|nr:hypothetical protein [Planctomycetota bacterium]